MQLLLWAESNEMRPPRANRLSPVLALPVLELPGWPLGAWARGRRSLGGGLERWAPACRPAARPAAARRWQSLDWTNPQRMTRTPPEDRRARLTEANGRRATTACEEPPRSLPTTETPTGKAPRTQKRRQSPRNGQTKTHDRHQQQQLQHRRPTTQPEPRPHPHPRPRALPSPPPHPPLPASALRRWQSRAPLQRLRPPPRKTRCSTGSRARAPEGTTRPHVASRRSRATHRSRPRPPERTRRPQRRPRPRPRNRPAPRGGPRDRSKAHRRSNAGQTQCCSRRQRVVRRWKRPTATRAEPPSGRTRARVRPQQRPRPGQTPARQPETAPRRTAPPALQTPTQTTCRSKNRAWPLWSRVPSRERARRAHAPSSRLERSFAVQAPRATAARKTIAETREARGPREPVSTHACRSIFARSDDCDEVWSAAIALDRRATRRGREGARARGSRRRRVGGAGRRRQQIQTGAGEREGEGGSPDEKGEKAQSVGLGGAHLSLRFEHEEGLTRLLATVAARCLVMWRCWSL